jgi:hypothetical protein
MSKSLEKDRQKLIYKKGNKSDVIFHFYARKYYLMSKVVFFLFLLSIQLSFAQTKIISGIVSDTLSTPLENANVLAKSISKKPISL